MCEDKWVIHVDDIKVVCLLVGWCGPVCVGMLCGGDDSVMVVRNGFDVVSRLLLFFSV